MATFAFRQRGARRTDHAQRDRRGAHAQRARAARCARLQTLPFDARDWRTGIDQGVADLRIAYSPDLGYAKVDAEVRRSCARRSTCSPTRREGGGEEPGFENPEAAFRTHWFAPAAQLVNALPP